MGAPTAKPNRLPAVLLYIEGEALCDANAVAEGVTKMREAFALAWELDLPKMAHFERAVCRPGSLKHPGPLAHFKV